jgi:hypothetical protein
LSRRPIPVRFRGIPAIIVSGEVNRLGTHENSSGVGSYLVIQAQELTPITHQPAAFGEPPEGINRGHRVASRKRDNLLTPSDEERIRDHEQCISPSLDHDAKGCLKIRFSFNRRCETMAEFLWTQRSNFGPGPLESHAMNFDSQRGRTVLFGGNSGSAVLGDTWEWHGCSALFT